MGKVYRNARPGEVATGMRVTLKRASGRLEVDRFAQRLERFVLLANEGEVGLTRAAFRRQWSAHFLRVADLAEPEVVAQLRAAFLSSVGRTFRRRRNRPYCVRAPGSTRRGERQATSRPLKMPRRAGAA